MRGGEDARVGAVDALASQAVEVSVLDHLQQLDLALVGQVSDLVEKDRPTRGELEQAQVTPLGSGERSTFVAEQLRVEHGRREARDVDFAVRTGAARAPAVDAPRDEALARTGLAEDQNRDVRCGGAPGERPQFAHCRAFPHDPVERRKPLCVLAECALSVPHRGLKSLGQLVVMRCLAHEVDGPGLHRTHDGLGVVVGRQHHDRKIRIQLVGPLEHLEPARFAGPQIEVEQDHVRFVAFDGGSCRGRVCSLDDIVAALKQATHERPQVGAVVDNENPRLDHVPPVGGRDRTPSLRSTRALRIGALPASIPGALRKVKAQRPGASPGGPAVSGLPHTSSDGSDDPTSHRFARPFGSV